MNRCSASASSIKLKVAARQTLPRSNHHHQQQQRKLFKRIPRSRPISIKTLAFWLRLCFVSLYRFHYDYYLLMKWNITFSSQRGRSPPVMVLLLQPNIWNYAGGQTCGHYTHFSTLTIIIIIIVLRRRGRVMFSFFWVALTQLLVELWSRGHCALFTSVKDGHSVLHEAVIEVKQYIDKNYNSSLDPNVKSNQKYFWFASCNLTKIETAFSLFTFSLFFRVQLALAVFTPKFLR